jgi:hypothetical protein
MLSYLRSLFRREPAPACRNRYCKSGKPANGWYCASCWVEINEQTRRTGYDPFGCVLRSKP